MNRVLHSTLVIGASFLVTCNHSTSPSGFIVVRADRHTAGTSAYPLAVDQARVGTYPAETHSGAGYFYDDVLEYRVWLNPENGATPLNGTQDYFVAFAQYEVANEFSKNTKGADEPIVLVRQLEWISEPEHGHFIPEKGERITEWQVPWLLQGKRNPRSVQEFLKHPYEAGP